MNVNEEIKSKLIKVFKNRFDINIENFDADLYETNLLDSRIGIAPRDLVYLFFDIENEFKVKISEQSIISERFSTINNIHEIVKELITNDLNNKAV